MLVLGLGLILVEKCCIIQKKLLRLQKVIAIAKKTQIINCQNNNVMKRKFLLGLACLSLFAGVAFAKMYKTTTTCGKVHCFYSGDMTDEEIIEYADYINAKLCGEHADNIIMN